MSFPFLGFFLEITGLNIKPPNNTDLGCVLVVMPNEDAVKDGWYLKGRGFICGFLFPNEENFILLFGGVNGGLISGVLGDSNGGETGGLFGGVLGGEMGGLIGGEIGGDLGGLFGGLIPEVPLVILVVVVVGVIGEVVGVVGVVIGVVIVREIGEVTLVVGTFVGVVNLGSDNAVDNIASPDIDVVPIVEGAPGDVSIPVPGDVSNVYKSTLCPLIVVTPICFMFEIVVPAPLIASNSVPFPIT
jgi:hypothetical protein